MTALYALPPKVVLGSDAERLAAKWLEEYVGRVVHNPEVKREKGAINRGGDAVRALRRETSITLMYIFIYSSNCFLCFAIIIIILRTTTLSTRCNDGAREAECSSMLKIFITRS